MKTGTTIALVAVAAVAIGAAIFFVDIDQTEEARLPDVDVSVEGGNMPEFEARTGSIEVGSTELDVTVPKVEFGTEEKTVEAPTISINSPEEEAAEEARQASTDVERSTATN